jgi:hypothetical protein
MLPWSVKFEPDENLTRVLASYLKNIKLEHNLTEELLAQFLVEQMNFDSVSAMEDQIYWTGTANGRKHSQIGLVARF